MGTSGRDDSRPGRIFRTEHEHNIRPGRWSGRRRPHADRDASRGDPRARPDRPASLPGQRRLPQRPGRVRVLDLDAARQPALGVLRQDRLLGLPARLFRRAVGAGQALRADPGLRPGRLARLGAAQGAGQAAGDRDGHPRRVARLHDRPPLRGRAGRAAGRGRPRVQPGGDLRLRVLGPGRLRLVGDGAGRAADAAAGRRRRAQDGAARGLGLARLRVLAADQAAGGDDRAAVRWPTRSPTTDAAAAAAPA